ncbi:MAG: DUF1287 domain-containing protein [Maricaulaceae bacterium]
MFADRLALAAEARTRRFVRYDPAYRRLDYPMGDVPDDRGVCIDVVIRAYRAVGVDLQVEIHEDMSAAFAAYPEIWGLSRPDPNIDHRRVPNLETFLARAGAELPASADPADYRPGDVVTYRIENGLPHAAIVSSRTSADGRPLIVHNIGAGTRIEDRLFDWPVHRLYRWSGPAE